MGHEAEESGKGVCVGGVDYEGSNVVGPLRRRDQGRRLRRVYARGTARESRCVSSQGRKWFKVEEDTVGQMVLRSDEPGG